MFRHKAKPRPEWQKTVESQGLVFPLTKKPDGTVVPYWLDGAFYEFDLEEVTALEEATEELDQMCRAAAHELVTGRFGNLALPPGALEFAAHSLETDPPSLYGRFDLWFDGHEIKLLEFNADTPTGAVESAVAQWYWLQDQMPSCDQFNSLHDRLVMQWQRLKPRLTTNTIHFAHFALDTKEEDGEEWMTVCYLRDTAHQAGLQTVGITVQDIGWDSRTKRFVDRQENPIATCFALYPWENMLAEGFGEHLMTHPEATTWIEPPWKVVLSNKALLAALWELNPDHRLLLPAYLDGPRDLPEFIQKPLHGREGSGMKWTTVQGSFEAPNQEWGPEGYCYQEWKELPSFDGNYAVVGSWVVDGKAAGIGVRESDGPVTDYYARFVSNVISAPAPDEAQVQAWLREE